MYNIRLLSISLFFIVLLLAGCGASKNVPVAAQADPLKPVWTSETDKLRSTAVLIEASRQKMLGNWSQATVLYHDALTIDPENDAAHFELAKIHAMQGQFNDALTYAREAVRLSPENHHYLTALADIYILNNELEPAIATYKDLVGKYPANPEYAYNLAAAYMYNNQQDAALEMYEHLESLIGFTEEISVEKQKIWVAQGKFEKAIEEAQKLIGLFPDEMVYYELLGDLYRETGQTHEAGLLYGSMLEKDPENPMALLLMADYQLETGKKEEAFALLLKAFNSPLLDKEAKSRIIYRYYLLSEQEPMYLDQALELSRLMVEIHPEDPESYLIYGDFMNREERFEEAREAYLKAASLDPSRLNIWQQILGIDGRLADFKSMRQHAEMALEYFFEHAVLFLFNGLANLQLENYNDAASSLEYGLTLAESDEELKEDFYSLLGDAHHYLDHPQLSDEYYEKALVINPENATVLNNYSYHLSVRKERLEEAESMSARAIKIEEGNPAFLDTYGWIMYQQGRYEEARTYIEQSIRNADTPSAAVLEHFGDVLFRLGRIQEALEYWEQAKAAGEGSEFLERKIRDKMIYE